MHYTITVHSTFHLCNGRNIPSNACVSLERELGFGLGRESLHKTVVSVGSVVSRD